MEKLVILRSIRPDKVIFAVKSFVTKHMGEQFIHVPTFDLASSFQASDKLKPIILILTHGCDPLASVYAFSPENPEDKPKDIVALSLGQGQGPSAEEAILEAAHKGSWVILQNCHLAEKWMERLAKVWEDSLLGDPESVNPAFRIWLTSYATPNFPSQLLQSGVKVRRTNTAITFEPNCTNSQIPCFKGEISMLLYHFLALFIEALNMKPKIQNGPPAPHSHMHKHTDFEISRFRVAS